MQTIPDRWREPLREYLRETFGDERDRLSATDFRHSVRLRFPDGSSAYFRHAFYILSRSLEEIAVFSEHCGYHFFPLAGAEAELLDEVRNEIGGS